MNLTAYDNRETIFSSIAVVDSHNRCVTTPAWRVVVYSIITYDRGSRDNATEDYVHGTGHVLDNRGPKDIVDILDILDIINTHDIHDIHDIHATI
jgi:hypothetical protein